MNLTIDGSLPKPGDTVKVKDGSPKLKGKVGKIVQRRNKNTGFITHRAGPLGHIWVQFGKRKDNTLKIEKFLPGFLLSWVIPKKKRGAGQKVDILSIMDELELELQDA